MNTLDQILAFAEAVTVYRSEAKYDAEYGGKAPPSTTRCAAAARVLDELRRVEPIIGGLVYTDEARDLAIVERLVDDAILATVRLECTRVLGALRIGIVERILGSDARATEAPPASDQAA